MPEILNINDNKETLHMVGIDLVPTEVPLIKGLKTQRREDKYRQEDPFLTTFADDAAIHILENPLETPRYNPKTSKEKH